MAYQIKAGDAVVIPAETGHWFTKIDDHIDYVMIRIDPDKVTPLKDEAASNAYLSKPAPRGQKREEGRRKIGHEMVTYESPGCIILDVRLPDRNGLDLQAALARREVSLPIIFVTGHREIPDTVRAIQRGAIDYLTKPVDGDVLLAAVGRALA